MNIYLHFDREMPSDLTGGEYAVPVLDIYVDSRLPRKTQQMLVVHAVIENFCRNWAHSKVEELCDYLDEAIEQLGE